MTDIVATLREQGLDDAADEIERLRTRLLEAEAIVAYWHGQMGTPEADEPANFTFDVPPTTPRE